MKSTVNHKIKKQFEIKKNISCSAYAKKAMFGNSFGWGPALSDNAQIQIPYLPFSKQDSLGKPADWFQQQYSEHHRSAVHRIEQDEGQGIFSLVDSKPKTRRSARGGFAGIRGAGPISRRDAFMPAQGRGGTGQKFKTKGKVDDRRKWGVRNWDKQAREVLASIQIDPKWEMVKEMPIANFTKVNKNVEMRDIVTAGKVKVFDAGFDKINTKSYVPLKRFDDVQFNVTTSEDPLIQRIAEQENLGNVFATDKILALLMAFPKSVNSWDVLVRKENNKIFLDKRPLSQMDFLSVYETSNERFTDEIESINHPINLSKEATFINENFGLQVLKGQEIPLGEENPFSVELDDSAKVAPVGYRYRLIELENDIKVVCRCEVSCVITSLDDPLEHKYLTVRALNEYESQSQGAGNNWRQKLDSQKGSILLTEFKNNSFKMSRWIAESVLSSSDQIRIGFVSRVNSEDPWQHSILGTMKYKPEQLAQLVGVNPANLFGVLRAVIEEIQQLADGSYLIFRVPNEPLVRIYRVPTDAFKHELYED
jgi:translation initiation factor 3 subunit D